MKKKILFIDDEFDFLELMKEELSVEFEVTLCGTAEEAIKIVSEKVFSLIFTDVHLPGMNGLELCSFVRNLAIKQPRILLLTGETSEDLERKVHAAGGDYIINKPFDMSTMIAIIRNFSSRD